MKTPKPKRTKPCTKFSSVDKVKREILKYEEELKSFPTHSWDKEVMSKRNEVKTELNRLYRVRHEQKNYTPPPKRIKI